MELCYTRKKTKGKVNDKGGNMGDSTNREYKKEYRKYLTAAILDNANNQIASQALMTAFAIYLGIPDFWIGLHVVLDTITNVLQVLAAPLFSRIGQSKKVVLTNYAIYRLSSVAFAFVPFLSQDINVRTILFFIPAILYAVTGELGYITFVNWRMTLLKKEDRGRFSATKSAYKNTIVVLFSFLMGILLDYFRSNGNESIGFSILFGVVFFIAVIDIAIRIHTIKPEIKQEKIELGQSIKMPAKDKRFRKILLFCGGYRFAIGIGMVYLNVYLLRYLTINYFYYCMLNVTIYLAEAMFGLFWSKKIGNRDWKRILIPMILCYILSFSCFLLVNSSVLVYLLPIIYILIGCGNSAYDLYDNIAIYEGSLKGYETSYVTFERLIEGVATACIPILTSTVLKNSANAIQYTFLISLVCFVILFFYLIVKYFAKEKECLNEIQ